METRLHAAGIHSVATLCAVPKPVLRGVWGGVLGDRLWHLLRGDEIPDLVSARKSIGHSHVLPPASRPPAHAWPILCKLLHKACERLRSHGLLAGSLTLQLAFLGGPAWTAETRTAETDSTIALLRLLERLWRDRPEPRRPLLQVGVVLAQLCEHGNYTPPLFELTTDRRHHPRPRQTPPPRCRPRPTPCPLRPQGRLLRQRSGKPRPCPHAHQLHPYPGCELGAGLTVFALCGRRAGC